VKVVDITRDIKQHRDGVEAEISGAKNLRKSQQLYN
jgi:hypothetical protein